MPFVLARIQLKYGKTQEFNEIMPHIVSGMERHGWKLLGAYATMIGPLNEVWDLWEVDGANTVPNALSAARLDPEFATWAARLVAVAEHEELRYLHEMPYSAERSKQ